MTLPLGTSLKCSDPEWVTTCCLVREPERGGSRKLGSFEPRHFLPLVFAGGNATLEEPPEAAKAPDPLPRLWLDLPLFEKDLQARGLFCPKHLRPAS